MVLMNSYLLCKVLVMTHGVRLPRIMNNTFSWISQGKHV